MKTTLLAFAVVTVLSACGGAASDSTDSSSSSDTGVSTSSDALNYPQVSYSFTCQATNTSATVSVSNGPCLSSQKAYTKATSCNEVGADYSFNYVGRPYYQCLVNNSSGDYRKYYQQYLSFYGG
jgi:ABC-type glycerol-3-phosphate transport system substrate-binding protein